MTDRLRGKTTLLTAAGQGIGRATALAFAREGADVVATDVNTTTLESLARQCPGIRTELLNVRDPAAVQALADRLGAVDVLFNCAGYVHHGTILDCDEEAWNFSLDLNVTSMYRITRALLPAMVRAGRGNIISMSSVASSITATPNRFVYSVTKAAVIGFTKALAADFVAQGIRANAICPGTVDTPSLHERIKTQGGDFEATRQTFIARQPMGRFGKPEEVAELAVYLASDESAFTTGQIHVVDGGWSM
jgi:2-keto-3-deoxy-L-fuconate dehydrogenase